MNENLYVEQEMLEDVKSDVTVWRQSVREQYPWPTDIDNLKFAMTELGEALDAEMRQNAEYKRNNKKGHTVKEELGDAMLMILSVRDYTPGNVIVAGTDGLNVLGAIAALANATILFDIDETKTEKIYSLLDITVSFIFGHPDFDIMSVYDTMKKLNDKHVDKNS